MQRIAQTCRTVICVGRNYVDHIKELNNEMPKEPVLFLKPPGSILLPNQGPVLIPNRTDNVHYEVELGLVIGSDGKNIPQKQALEHISGYFVALDMTSRDLQSVAKKKGLPWSIAKGYDTFLPVSELIPKQVISDPNDATLFCNVNGEVKQHDSTSLMIHSVPSIVSHISTIFSLREGDLILTGTPKGVGKLQAGDVLTFGLDGVDSSVTEVAIAQAPPLPSL